MAAAELARYGVTVNAIAPSARTRMTADLFPDLLGPDGTRWNPADVGEAVDALLAGTPEPTPVYGA